MTEHTQTLNSAAKDVLTQCFAGDSKGVWHVKNLLQVT